MNTSYHILYHTELLEGTPGTSQEVLESGFFDYEFVTHWHRDHQEKAQCAYEYWLRNVQEKSV